jgi:UDP-glucose 4-epimerase
MKVVLVTGARGFVGASLIEHILETTDWEVYYQKRPPKPDDRLSRMNLMNRVHPWEGQKDPHFILHIAGNPSSLSCIDDPTGAVNDNILETLKMLELARKYKHSLEHFIYFSSVEVYGKSGTCIENDVCTAKNMYAATKHAGEQMSMAYRESYGVPCSIVRLNNSFGHFCQEERFPVMAIKKLLNNEKFILHTYDGEIVGRRWTPIYDVAEMVLFILQQKHGKIYNTTGEFISNLEFVKHIAHAMNITNFEYETIEENVAGRIGSQDAPPDFIKSLGWTPSKTFEQRVKDFVHQRTKFM